MVVGGGGGMIWACFAATEPRKPPVTETTMNSTLLATYFLFRLAVDYLLLSPHLLFDVTCSVLACCCPLFGSLMKISPILPSSNIDQVLSSSIILCLCLLIHLYFTCVPPSSVLDPLFCAAVYRFPCLFPPGFCPDLLHHIYGVGFWSLFHPIGLSQPLVLPSLLVSCFFYCLH